MESFENYLNVLIFMFLMKGFGVVLVLLFLFDWGRALSYMITTVVIGAIVVIIVMMWRISSLDGRTERIKANMASALPALQSCPEYYVRKIGDNDDVVCHNTYTTPDGRYTYTVGPSEPVNITEVLANSKTMEELCMKSDNYKQYPWTEYKAKCNNL